MTESPTVPRPDTFVPLPDDIRAFLDAPRFATIATVDAEGAPRQAVIWYTREGDELVLNSAVGRRWPSNLLRDPRVAFSVVEDDGSRWVGITGVVTVVEDQATAQADIAGMARRYHADDPAKADRLIHGQFERQARISFRLRATGIVDHRD
jgi:PPOX class probable F420-dependent enzyme